MLSVRIKGYFKDLKASMVGLDDSIEKVSEILKSIKTSKRRMWILGNGGSLAIAQHFAQDLLKMCGIRASCLNDPSVITAYANDDRFDYAYYNPISRLIDKEDVILIFSCSGKSRNYIEFVSGFPENKHFVVSIVGKDGGFLREKSSACIHIKSNDYQICETAFCIVADLLVKSLLEEK